MSSDSSRECLQGIMPNDNVCHLKKETLGRWQMNRTALRTPDIGLSGRKNLPLRKHVHPQSKLIVHLMWSVYISDRLSYRFHTLKYMMPQICCCQSMYLENYYHIYDEWLCVQSNWQVLHYWKTQTDGSIWHQRKCSQHLHWQVTANIYSSNVIRS